LGSSGWRTLGRSTSKRIVSELLIITGPPGAGKSTVAQLVVDRFEPGALVQGDVFFGFVARGYIDPWLPASHEQNTVVTEATARATSVFARGGFTTVFDGMVGPWFLPTFLANAELAAVHYVVLIASVETCVARVRGRADHGFRDEDVTRQMHASFAAAGIESRSVVDAEPDAAAVGREVLRRFDTGELAYPTTKA
jgi:cytidylate kinase